MTFRSPRFLPLLFLTGTFCQAQDALLTVANTDDEGEGSLRAALENVALDGRIVFDPTLSGMTITLDDEALLIRRNLEIDASMLTDGITIDGGENGEDGEVRHRLFQVSSGTSATFSNLILRNGSTENGEDGQSGVVDVHGKGAAHGGAIFNAGTLTLNRCQLTGNQTGIGGNGGSGRGGRGGQGGAIYNSGDLILIDCTLSGNQSGNGGNGGGGAGGFGFGGTGGPGGEGGAIFNASSGTLQMSGCTLNDNQSGAGGLGGNGVGFGGNGGGGGLGGNGGALSNQGKLMLVNCTLTDNTTGVGGLGGDAAQNRAGNGGSGGKGGAVYSDSDEFEMTHCTVTANQTGEAGLGGFREGEELRSGETGEIGEGGGIFTDTEMKLTNSIVSANVATTALDLAGPFESLGENITTSELPINLRELGDYGGVTETMPPFLTSRVIDASDFAPAVETDQRGVDRGVDLGRLALRDLGAVEVQNSEAVTEFNFLFSLDNDNDGLSNGEEAIRGTDPEVADNPGTENFALVLNPASPGANILKFAYRASYLRLQVLRSTDLENFTVIADTKTTAGFEATSDATLIEVIDENPPAGKAFYRLQAVRPD